MSKSLRSSINSLQGVFLRSYRRMDRIIPLYMFCFTFPHFLYMSARRKSYAVRMFGTSCFYQPVVEQLHACQHHSGKNDIYRHSIFIHHLTKWSLPSYRRNESSDCSIQDHLSTEVSVFLAIGERTESSPSVRYYICLV